MIRSIVLLLPLLLTLTGCAGSGSTAADGPEPGSLAREVAARHGLQAWRGKGALRATVTFTSEGGSPRTGEILYSQAQDRVRIDLEGGPTLVLDAQRTWRAKPRAFGPVFLVAAPFLLGDTRAQVEEIGSQVLIPGGAPLRLGHITFRQGLGDPPGDWFDAYVEPDGTLKALGYELTAMGKRKEEDSKSRACLYSDYVDVEGVWVARQWAIHDWTRASGIQGEPLGTGSLTEIRFVTPDPDAFALPGDD